MNQIETLILTPQNNRPTETPSLMVCLCSTYHIDTVVCRYKLYEDVNYEDYVIDLSTSARQ